MKKKFLISLLAIILCFTLIGCSKSEDGQKIIGKWANATIKDGKDFVYTFNADGTGNYTAAGEVTNFKFTIEGNQILFDYEVEDIVDFKTKFSIKKDYLTIKNSIGKKVKYKRIK